MDVKQQLKQWTPLEMEHGDPKSHCQCGSDRKLPNMIHLASVRMPKVKAIMHHFDASSAQTKRQAPSHAIANALCAFHFENHEMVLCTMAISTGLSDLMQEPVHNTNGCGNHPSKISPLDSKLHNQLTTRLNNTITSTRELLAATHAAKDAVLQWQNDFDFPT